MERRISQGAADDALYRRSVAGQMECSTRAEDLPEALWSGVLGVLPSRDLLMAGQVSRAWKRATDPLWHERALRQAVPPTLGPSLRASVTRASIREACLRAWKVERHVVKSAAPTSPAIGCIYPRHPTPVWHTESGQLVITSGIAAQMAAADQLQMHVWDPCRPHGPVATCAPTPQATTVPWFHLGREGRIGVMPLVCSDGIKAGYPLAVFRIASGALLHVTDDLFEKNPWLAICDAAGDEHFTFKRPNAESLRVVRLGDSTSMFDVSAPDGEQIHRVMFSPRGSRSLVFLSPIRRTTVGDRNIHGLLAVDVRDGSLAPRRDYTPGGRIIQQSWHDDEAGCAWWTDDGSVTGFFFDGDASDPRATTLSVHPVPPQLLSAAGELYDPIASAWWSAPSRVLRLLWVNGVVDCVDFSGQRPRLQSRWTEDAPHDPLEEGGAAQARWKSATPSPDQRWLAYRSTKRARVVRADTGELVLVHSVVGSRRSLRAMAWAPNSRAFAICEDVWVSSGAGRYECDLRVFCLLEAAAKPEFVERKSDRVPLSGMALSLRLNWSPDGGALALSTDDNLFVFTWRPRTAA